MKKIFWVIVLAMIFCPFVIPSYAEEDQVEIRDGVIYFPEKDVPTVVPSKLTFSFPTDCPQEILNVKGKVFRGELKYGEAGRRTSTHTSLSYLIPMGYNSDTKEMAVYYVWGGARSFQGTLKGTLDLANGSVLHLTGSTSTTEYRLYFLEKGKLRINLSNGYSGDYSPVGSLPG
jgi:hypothetical protein